MSNGAVTDKENRDDTRALISATDAGDAARVASLVSAGSRADSRLPNGETPLMRAASRGFEDVARVLLDAGADANARRDDGFTPLVLAVFFGHEAVVRLLLERGADTVARTQLGTTAEHWADARGFAEIAALLRSADDARPRKGTAHSKSERAHVEDVSIFSRTRERGVATVAFARANTAELASSTLVASSNAPASATSRSASSSSASTSSAHVPEAGDSAASASAANVSIRRGDRVPSHPSASAFRLTGFLRSWQASVGTALLVFAVGVGIFAVRRDGKTANRSQPSAPTPQSPAPQTVAQPTASAQSLPVPQPSPAIPTTDAQGSAAPTEVPGATYVVPVPAGQPFYNPPNPGQANAPREPTVISESGAPSTGDASHQKSKGDAASREASSAASTSESSNETNSDGNSRAGASGRSTRATETQPARPSTTAPAPTATPEHGKVIQWPPQ
jgi:hypothetical protein